MDTSTYRQEYACFTGWLEESGNDGLPPEIQAALWQGWLGRASQQEAEGFKQPAACVGSEAAVRAPNPLALQLREYLYRLRDKSA